MREVLLVAVISFAAGILVASLGDTTDYSAIDDARRDERERVTQQYQEQLDRVGTELTAVRSALRGSIERSRRLADQLDSVSAALEGSARYAGRVGDLVGGSREEGRAITTGIRELIDLIDAADREPTETD